MKEDLRVIKTRNAIIKAFKEMILEKEASKIQVKELSERAMIHRKTFYLHFSSIEALYEEILSELASDYFKDIDKLDKNAPFTEVNRVFFNFMARQEPYVEKMVCDPSYREFSDRFFYSLLIHNRSRFDPYAKYSIEERNIINTFLAVNSVAIYRKWVEDNKKIPLEDLIELSGKLFYRGISSIV